MYCLSVKLKKMGRGWCGEVLLLIGELLVHPRHSSSPPACSLFTMSWLPPSSNTNQIQIHILHPLASNITLVAIEVVAQGTVAQNTIWPEGWRCEWLLLAGMASGCGIGWQAGMACVLLLKAAFLIHASLLLKTILLYGELKAEVQMYFFGTVCERTTGLV